MRPSGPYRCITCVCAMSMLMTVPRASANKYGKQKTDPLSKAQMNGVGASQSRGCKREHQRSRKQKNDQKPCVGRRASRGKLPALLVSASTLTRGRLPLQTHRMTCLLGKPDFGSTSICRVDNTQRARSRPSSTLTMVVETMPDSTLNSSIHAQLVCLGPALFQQLRWFDALD